jgi:hypothetical protein
MDNHIIPKVAYIPLEYTLSVDKFLGLWNELEDVGEPTQKDYDEWFLDGAKGNIFIVCEVILKIVFV